MRAVVLGTVAELRDGTMTDDDLLADLEALKGRAD
jgi:hypothetical protein